MAEREVLDAWMKSLGLEEYDSVLKEMGLDLVEDLGLRTRSPCRRARVLEALCAPAPDPRPRACRQRSSRARSSRGRT